MKERCSKKTVIRIMGAYVSWVMGSGFATGQEIFQFFTSYGYKSFALIAIDLAGFVVVGGMLLTGTKTKMASHRRGFSAADIWAPFTNGLYRSACSAVWLF